MAGFDNTDIGIDVPKVPLRPTSMRLAIDIDEKWVYDVYAAPAIPEELDGEGNVIVEAVPAVEMEGHWETTVGASFRSDCKYSDGPGKVVQKEAVKVLTTTQKQALAALEPVMEDVWPQLVTKWMTQFDV